MSKLEQAKRVFVGRMVSIKREITTEAAIEGLCVSVQFAGDDFLELILDNGAKVEIKPTGISDTEMIGSIYGYSATVKITSTPMRPKVFIVLEALLTGITVTLGGIPFRLFKEGEEVPLSSGETGVVEAAYFLGYPMQSGERTIYMGADDTLNFVQFLTRAEDISHEEAVLIAANTALMKINRNRRVRANANYS